MHIGVIGLGYVGLSLLKSIPEHHTITGIDIDKDKVKTLQDDFSEVDNINITDYYPKLIDVDVICICVPTQINSDNRPDLTSLLYCIQNVLLFSKHQVTIIIESTTYPTTTRNVVLPFLERKGKVGKDFYLGYSPERIDTTWDYQIKDIPKVVSGITPKCTEKVKDFYSEFIDEVHVVSSTEIAETSKLLENTFRFINISFINEFANICERLDIDVWETIQAADTKPFGFMTFYPTGAGIGGHCIPNDPHHFNWIAQQYAYQSLFVGISTAINDSMISKVTDKIKATIYPTKLKNTTILIVGVSYKTNTDDVRNSTSVKVIQCLLDNNAKIIYNDTYVPCLKIGNYTYTSQDLTPDLIKSVDCVVILTHHTNTNYRIIRDNTDKIVDTCNVI